MSFEEMCEDKDVTGAALREIINYGKAHKLEKFEIPGKYLPFLIYNFGTRNNWLKPGFATFFPFLYSLIFKRVYIKGKNNQKIIHRLF